MNNDDNYKELIEKIILIEQENMESADSESNEIRGKIVNLILSELDKVVVSDED